MAPAGDGNTLPLAAFFDDLRAAQSAYASALARAAETHAYLGQYGHVAARLVAQTAESADAHARLERVFASRTSPPSEGDDPISSPARAYHAGTAALAQRLASSAQATQQVLASSGLGHSAGYSPGFSPPPDAWPASGQRSYTSSPPPAATGAHPPQRWASSRSNRGLERGGSRRRAGDAPSASSPSQGGIKRVDSVSRGTQRHRPGAGSVSIQLSDEPMWPQSPPTGTGTTPGAANPSASTPFSNPHSTPASASGLLQDNDPETGHTKRPGRAPPPRQPLLPSELVSVGQKDQTYFSSHIRGTSVPLHTELSSPLPSTPDFAGEPNGDTSLKPTRSRSQSSLRDGSESKNALKSAFSRLGKGKHQNPHPSRPPPSSSTGTADAGAQDPGPAHASGAPLKRSLTLGSIMGKRRGRKASGPGSRPSSPANEDGGIIYDDTLRQIYRTAESGPIEVQNLAYSGARNASSGPTPAQAVMAAAKSRPTHDPEDDAKENKDQNIHRVGSHRRIPPLRPGERSQRKIPPPQPVGLEDPLHHDPSARARRQGNANDLYTSGRDNSSPLGASDDEEHRHAAMISAGPLAPQRAPIRRSPSSGTNAAYQTPPVNSGNIERTKPAQRTLPLRPSPGTAAHPVLPDVSPHAVSSTAAVTGAGTNASRPSDGDQRFGFPYHGPPALRPSITETVHAVLSGSTVQRSEITGEIRLTLADSTEAQAGESDPRRRNSRYVPLTLLGFEALERTAPHPTLLVPPNSTPGHHDQPDLSRKKEGSYMLDLWAARQAISAHGFVVIFRYSVSPHSVPPEQRKVIEVGAQWRCEPGSARALLTYSVNPLTPIPVEGLELATSVSGGVTSALSKPTGLWDEGAQIIKWAVPCPPSNPKKEQYGVQNAEDRILARFDVPDGVVPQAGHVAVRWTGGRGVLLSPLSILAGELGEEERESVLLPALKATVAGKYIVMQQ